MAFRCFHNEAKEFTAATCREDEIGTFARETLRTAMAVIRAREYANSAPESDRAGAYKAHIRRERAEVRAYWKAREAHALTPVIR